MPRGSGKAVTPAVSEQRRLLWEMTGDNGGNGLRQWDAKADVVLEALLGIVSTGAVVMLRPGSGGRALGIAIWEGDVRHPATWLYESLELDDWSQKVCRRLRDDISQAAD
jgi:hypothetical protein